MVGVLELRGCQAIGRPVKCTVGMARRAVSSVRSRFALYAVQGGLKSVGSQLRAMKVSVSIEVPTLENGIQFYGEVFGFIGAFCPHPSCSVLESGSAGA